MSGLMRKSFPTVFDRHQKESASMFECFRAVELCVKCLTKRDKVWMNELMLIDNEDNSTFPKGCGFQSSNALVSVPCLGGKGVEEGHGEGMNTMAFPHFFCIYLFIIIYYGSSAETLT